MGHAVPCVVFYGGACLRTHRKAEVGVICQPCHGGGEGVDIAILVGRPQDSTLIARKVLETSRRLYASPDYLAQHGTPQTVAELAGHRAILLPQDPPRYWPVQGESIACQRVLACNNITFAREAALAGAGIVGLPHMICREALQDGRLLELLPQACLPTSELTSVAAIQKVLPERGS